MEYYRNLANRASNGTRLQFHLMPLPINTPINEYLGIGEKFVPVQQQKVKHQISVFDGKSKFHLAD